jgi:hypothetical protein
MPPWIKRISAIKRNDLKDGFLLFHENFPDPHSVLDAAWAGPVQGSLLAGTPLKFRGP